MIRRLTRSGQSILEVVIATTLISMGVIAALSLTNQSQKSSNFAKVQGTATAYNNQLADYLRNQKAILGYATLAEKFLAEDSGGVATYCFATLPTSTALFLAHPAGSCNPTTDYIPGTILRRELSVTTGSTASGLLELTITTSWEDNTTRTARLNLELSQWK